MSRDQRGVRWGLLGAVLPVALIVLLIALAGGISGHRPAYSGEAGRPIRRKLDSDSEGRWTLIPKEAGQRFRRKVDTRSEGI